MNFRRRELILARAKITVVRHFRCISIAPSSLGVKGWRGKDHLFDESKSRVVARNHVEQNSSSSGAQAILARAKIANPQASRIRREAYVPVGGGSVNG